MHRKNLLVNDGGDWQAVETIGKRLPQLDVVPPLAWVRRVRREVPSSGSGEGKTHTRRKSHISC